MNEPGIRETVKEKNDRDDRRLRKVCWSMLLTMQLVLGSMWTAQAEDRLIFVNGEQLNAGGLVFLDALNCGEPVPEGNYWLDLENRQWGFVGVEGREPLPDCFAIQQPSEEQNQVKPPAESDCESQYRFHEDRMCYCYGMC